MIYQGFSVRRKDLHEERGDDTMETYARSLYASEVEGLHFVSSEV